MLFQFKNVSNHNILDQGSIPPTLSQSSTAIWIVAVSYSDKPRRKIQQFRQIAVVTEIIIEVKSDSRNNNGDLCSSTQKQNMHSRCTYALTFNISCIYNIYFMVLTYCNSEMWVRSFRIHELAVWSCRPAPSKM